MKADSDAAAAGNAESERTRIHVLLGFSLYSIVNILPIAGPMYNIANVVWQLVHYTVYGTRYSASPRPLSLFFVP